MIVSELIQKLQTLPQDALVITEGYEDGYDTIKKVSLIHIEENPKQEWYLGKYIDSQEAKAMQAVFLNAETKADVK
jgi:hypothetical protein